MGLAGLGWAWLGSAGLGWAWLRLVDSAGLGWAQLGSVGHGCAWLDSDVLGWAWLDLVAGLPELCTNEAITWLNRYIKPTFGWPAAFLAKPFTYIIHNMAAQTKPQRHIACKESHHRAACCLA